jgi:MoxR-like ATPase
MLLVSIMNQIPILLIGKPGCSKSLAMNVLQTNLNGEVSNKDFFKTMPAVEVFAYQCSPLSTPEAILSAFHSARQSNLGNKKTIVCCSWTRWASRRSRRTYP